MSDYRKSFSHICESSTCNECKFNIDENEQYTCSHEGFYKYGYQQGRADAIDKAIKWAKKNYNISSHYKHNFSSERVIETTVNYDELIAKLEQVKEQTNE